MTVLSECNAAKTHCPRGHVYDSENTYIRKDGSRDCRLCERVRRRMYYATHKEIFSKYQGLHKEEIKETNKRWRQKNPERAAAHQALGKFKRRQQLADVRSDLTAMQWENIKELRGHLCAYCGLQKPLTQDHVIPVSKGGEHTAANIVPACRSCNSKKGNRILTG